MAKKPIALEKQPLQKRLASFVKTRLNFSALWYYEALLFMVVFLGLAVWSALPPFNKDLFVTSGLVFLLHAELSYYRYYNWKIEKSKGFRVGAQMLLNVVHDEGIFRYKRGDQEYALYSNKVAPKDSAK